MLGADEPPIDRSILVGQTGGDTALERDVLRLFLTKSAADMVRLAAVTSDAERSAVAHAIVGSARAIGATEVARLAAVVEHASGNAESKMEALAAAIMAVQQHIREVVGE